jgi:16S rRNA processing protein RimM
VSEYRRIAQIIRAKGLTGEVVAVSAYNLPLHFWQGIQISLVPPQHNLVRSGEITSAKEQQDENSFVLKISGIDDRTTAQKAVGCFLLAYERDCPELEDSIDDSVVGLLVQDEAHGCIGTIVEQRVGKAQTIWVVDGAFGEVLIPAVNDFVLARDESSVTVALPEGLLELTI